MPGKSATGEQILRLARKHVGEKYALGILVPKSNFGWTGPWDCAEFVSWVIYQASNILYGCDRATGNPALADAFTGYWRSDVESRGVRISISEATRTPGAAILRVPRAGGIGHVAISDGEGGTVEAYSANRGVTEDTISLRRWDMGILVPGIEYVRGSPSVAVVPPRITIYRLRRPRMTGNKVREIQRALKNAGFDPGGIDGEFGPMTQAAVIAFQISQALLPDGEVGPRTAKKLSISL